MICTFMAEAIEPRKPQRSTGSFLQAARAAIAKKQSPAPTLSIAFEIKAGVSEEGEWLE